MSLQETYPRSKKYCFIQLLILGLIYNVPFGRGLVSKFKNGIYTLSTNTLESINDGFLIISEEPLECF